MTGKTARPALNLAIATVTAWCWVHARADRSGPPYKSLGLPRRRRRQSGRIKLSAVGAWRPIKIPKTGHELKLRPKHSANCPMGLLRRASGGVVMHLADEAAPQDLRLKGSPGGKNYIGPPGPAGGEKDREVVSVDSRLLITRFVDPDAAKRYGYMVYVRCT